MSCTNCKGAAVERWLGVFWYGVPYPKRIRLKRAFPFVYAIESPACGCIAWLKDLWKNIKIVKHAFSRAQTIRRERYAKQMARRAYWNEQRKKSTAVDKCPVHPST